MCYLTVWKYISPPSCGHVLMWRDGCDDDNDLCCPKGKREVDFYKMSGNCKLCRKADYNKLFKQVQEHEEYMQNTKGKKQGLEITVEEDTSPQEKETIENVNSKTSPMQPQKDNQPTLMQEMYAEIIHMENMEAWKLERQRDAYVLKSVRAARASLRSDEDFLLPPPKLRGHPIETILELKDNTVEMSEDLEDLKKTTENETSRLFEKLRFEEELERQLTKRLEEFNISDGQNGAPNDPSVSDKVMETTETSEDQVKRSKEMAEEISDEKNAELRKFRRMNDLTFRMAVREEKAQKEREKDKKAEIEIQKITNDIMEWEASLSSYDSQPSFVDAQK